MQKKRFEYRNAYGQVHDATKAPLEDKQFPHYQQKNFYGQTINWAGGLHYRGNFNKTKDFLGDWTNVLFRN